MGNDGRLFGISGLAAEKRLAACSLLSFVYMMSLYVE